MVVLPEVYWLMDIGLRRNCELIPYICVVHDINVRDFISISNISFFYFNGLTTNFK